jgi:hypothetical protein
VIREISRLPTARCPLPMYISFLLSEPKSSSCCRLGEIMSISHDSVNRFLYREAYTPLELFKEVGGTLNLKGGTLSVDETV